MVIADKNIITMGRNDPVSGINPTLDLTEYHGSDLGVSRFHAEISINDGKYYIKDMGSTNGTYVNGTKIAPYKLTPIRNGDQIRLGHLSIVIGWVDTAGWILGESDNINLIIASYTIDDLIRLFHDRLYYSNNLYV